MDNETRFIIAQEVISTKDKADVVKLLNQAKENAGKKPITFITDGLPSYAVGVRKAFGTRRHPKTQHIRHIHLAGDMNNNRMERLNGEIRDRLKTARGLKEDHSPLIDGYKIYHNYFRSHMALNGKTPAQHGKVVIEGKNKFLTVIQNASRNI